MKFFLSIIFLVLLIGPIYARVDQPVLLAHAAIPVKIAPKPEVDKTVKKGLKATFNDSKSTNRLKVGTRIVKPFVFKDKDDLTGFSIELWRMISSQAGFSSEFDIHATLDEMLDDVKNEIDDAAISAISVTAKREQYLDFSQPMFLSGLGILVPTIQPASFWSFFQLLDFSQLSQVLLFFIIMIAIPAHIIWFYERGNDGEVEISKSYYPGVFDAAFWAATLLGGQAGAYPKRSVSKVVALIWVYASIFFIAYFTATITSSLTVQQLKGDIGGPSDLKGKKVATIRDSTAAIFLKEVGSTVVDYENIDEAIQALIDKKVAAVVYDRPVLQYYVLHDDTQAVQIVGDSFRDENYGIVFPPGSHLRKIVNEVLLQLREDGSYDQLYQKWFGNSDSHK